MPSQARRNRANRDNSRFFYGIAVAVQVVALALGALAALGFAWVVARRIAYPYDLEWMEGSMLHHALRVLDQKPIYAAPSIDFIPHLYTPLYPLLVALLGKLCGGVSYLVGRSVSLCAFVGALGIAVYWAFREGGSLVAALTGMALPVAAFADTGGFYDLVRCDSLQLFLTVAGAAVAFYGHNAPRYGHLRMALAALLLVAAFFAKQTAAPLIVCIGLGLLVTRQKPVLTFIAVGTVAFAALSYAQNRASGGWFWTYIYGLHQSHGFFARRAWIDTPLTLLRLIGLGGLLLPWALLAQIYGRSSAPASGLFFLIWLAVGGFFTACLGFGTQWAHINAFIPGLFFAALAIATAAGRLLGRSATARAQTATQRQGRALRQGLVWALLALGLWPRLRQMHPAAHIPTATDRQAGAALIERLRSASGDVLIPFHPFYAHLAGKRVFLHRMGIWDVRGTPAGPVRGLSAAFVQQRFARIIFDEKVTATWGDWPEVLQHYRIVEQFSGPHVVEGAQTVPALVLEPQAFIDRELQ